MDNQPQFIALRCETCGGNLDFPKQNVVGTADSGFTIIGNDVFTCQHCGTEYLPQQSLKRFGPDSGITIAGDVIAGDKVGGSVIHGNKVVFQQVQVRQDVQEPGQQTTVSKGIDTPVQPQKITKKWWQFWK